MKKTLGSVLIILMLVLTTTTITASKTNNIIYVDDDGGADYTSIQEAIDAASYGDTIYVYEGTYIGQININKTLVLTGEEKTTTIIDGQQLGEDTITITNFAVELTGFTIQNSPRGCGYNAGIKLQNANNCIIKNNIFTNNCWAAEIRESSYCEFSNNKIIDNVQGGIHLAFAPSATVTNCLFSGNERIGIRISRGNNQVIQSNNFIDCGISIGYEPPPGNTITCTIEDNTINGKPLVYLEKEQGKIINDAGQVILNQCNGIIIRNLDISGAYTGISVYKSNFISILGNTITDNHHGIGIGKSFFITIRNNKINNNWYNGIGLSGNILCRLSFNQITENNIGLYIHQSAITLPAINNIRENREHNYVIAPLFLPWTFHL